MYTAVYGYQRKLLGVTLKLDLSQRVGGGGGNVVMCYCMGQKETALVSNVKAILRHLAATLASKL